MLGSAPEGAVCYYSCKKNQSCFDSYCSSTTSWLFYSQIPNLTECFFMVRLVLLLLICLFFLQIRLNGKYLTTHGKDYYQQLLPAYKKCPFTATSVSNWSFQHSLCTPSLKIGPTCSALYIIITCFVPFDGSSEPTASVK